ncbi:MAG: helix-turn-helix transcriptional regulator [Akkermansia sp.]|nr:helix-turn-helix transcriptional regulator [Akkermansia sp.]
MKEPLFEPYCILLHRRRREMGFSVRELAKRSGVSPSYITDIETGRRDANDKQLQLLLAALHMHYADIIMHDCRPPVHEIRELCQTDKRLGVAFRAIVTAITNGWANAADIIAMFPQFDTKGDQP